MDSLPGTFVVFCFCFLGYSQTLHLHEISKTFAGCRTLNKGGEGGEVFGLAAQPQIEARKLREVGRERRRGVIQGTDDSWKEA